MLHKYLKNIGLEELVKDIERTPLNNLVTEVFAKSHDNFSREEIEKLYIYDVPKLGPNGACSITHEKEEKPYNLAHTLGLQDDEILKNHPQTLRLWRLKQIVSDLYKLTGVDWLGIYRKITKANGDVVLVKEVYKGSFSRAEFPLTQEFAKTSNNSTVGLSGKAVFFQDLLIYKGPYYECDGQVQSEYCGSILNKKGEVIGIIDAESFHKNFFTPEKILQLTKVCQDLGKINLGA